MCKELLSGSVRFFFLDGCAMSCEHELAHLVVACFFGWSATLRGRWSPRSLSQALLGRHQWTRIFVKRNSSDLTRCVKYPCTTARRLTTNSRALTGLRSKLWVMSRVPTPVSLFDEAGLPCRQNRPGVPRLSTPLCFRCLRDVLEARWTGVLGVTGLTKIGIC